MKDILKKYDLVVGLEVHVQLSTASKLFVADKNSFGDRPNANVSPITLGHPGTLPKPNLRAIELAIKMGLACHCKIASRTTFDRKNYFYPDLPKGYQTTQDEHPICEGGFLEVKSGDHLRKIQFNRIHIEEDAGKSMHDAEHEGSMLDFNRAGTPLIEMVTEPDIHTSEEAGNLLTEIRKIARFLDVSDGNMEEGSLRCDANISLKPKGASELGRRVEIKNMNSIRNVQRAIQYEVERQSALLDAGEVIRQETRGFNDTTGKTTGQRSKEEANDYRYFPCPDLLPIHISQEWLEKIKATMPRLPQELLHEKQQKYGLSLYDAELITETLEMANYYIETAEICPHYKRIANWMIGPVKNYLSENNIGIEDFSVSPMRLTELINLVDAGKLSFTIAAAKVFPEMINAPKKSAEQIATELELFQDNNESELLKTIENVIADMPEKVNAYKKGKKGLLGLFVGEVMKKSKGKANPKLANKLIAEALEK
ncbi:MAG: Asp-tRNA(Asn)/Glu-tRNA(Gln) amidotransferase subunit GatB [Reichenbachiella sp.]